MHLGIAELGETEGGKEYVEFTVIGKNEEEDTARVWFTTPAATNYSFNVIRQIIVHNTKEENKDKARKAVDAVKTTQELVDLLNEKCLGGELWFTKYYNPTRTYENKAGETKRSVDKNVYGYEPKEKPELMGDQGEIKAADLPEDEPFEDKPKKKADTNTVPDDASLS